MTSSPVPENPYFRIRLDELQCIAKGGMSYIYRGRQRSLDRYIVVKKLREELQHNPEMIERFRREAKALASVLHQNIAHVYDFVDSGNESYILMEYIQGTDLSTIIEKMGHLPPDIAAAIMLGICKGVSYIHAHNLIHRDIKPANIRLTTRGEVKLMDFGIAIDLDNRGLTKPGLMVGSPNYLSPEQVLGDAITPRADIFLVGICFYEMLAGTRPFKEEEGETVFQRIREAKYVPLREMQPKVPTALDKFVRKCLQKNPDKRFQNIKDLMEQLELFLGPSKSSHSEDVILKYLDEEALLKASVNYEPVQEKKRTFRQLFSWVAIACLIVFSVLAFLGGYELGQRVIEERELSDSELTPQAQKPPPPKSPKRK